MLVVYYQSSKLYGVILLSIAIRKNRISLDVDRIQELILIHSYEELPKKGFL